MQYGLQNSHFHSATDPKMRLILKEVLKPFYALQGFEGVIGFCCFAFEIC